MSIQIAINGVRQEPQAEEQVRAKITRGEIPAAALCWQSGWAEWQTVSSVYPEYFEGGAAAAAVPDVTAASPAVDVEAVRREHLTHEASVRSIGSLYLLGAVLSVFTGAMGLIAAASGAGEMAQNEDTTVALITSGLLLVLGGVQFVVARWLRRLDPKGRTPATILACLGLLAFPIGTLINAYFLYLLQSKKGAMVFSAEYAEIMAATPHIKYKTSVVTWVFLGLLVAGLVALVVAVAL